MAQQTSRLHRLLTLLDTGSTSTRRTAARQIGDIAKQHQGELWPLLRQEMLQELLPRVLPACMAGLEDPDDDVRAVAAEALTPAAAAIVASAGSKNVTAILLSLWDILLDLDDLSPSTSRSVMHLLSELYSQPQVDSKTVVEKPLLLDLNETMMDDHLGDTAGGAEDDPFLLSTLVPRLWPLMRHNITSVRLAAVRTLERLLESGDHGEKGDSRSSWAVPILDDALRMVFQNLLLESDETVIEFSQRVWRLLLQCPQANLAEEATAYLSSWLKLASTAAGAPLEASKMYSPNSLPRKSRGRAVAKLKAVRGGTPVTGEPSWTPPRPNKVREQASVVVGADGEKSAVHMRVTTAKALGIIAASLPSSLFPTVATYLTERLSFLSGTQRQLVVDAVLDDENQEGDADGEWPFYHIVELLIHDMFDPVWEVQHGSLLALREIISVKAASAGVLAPTVEAEAEPEAESGSGAEANEVDKAVGPSQAGMPLQVPARTPQEIWEASFLPGEIQLWSFGGLPTTIATKGSLFLCCICVEEVGVGDRIKFLPCMHSFHFCCIDAWLSVKALCPICKSTVI